MKYKGCEIKIYHVTPEYIIIAKQGYGHGDWRAYAGPVSNEHVEPTENEVRKILEHGFKVDQNLAEFLFPEFKRKYRWRE